MFVFMEDMRRMYAAVVVTTASWAGKRVATAEEDSLGYIESNQIS